MKQKLLVVGAGLSALRFLSQLDPNFADITVIYNDAGGLLKEILHRGAQYDNGVHVYALGTTFHKWCEQSVSPIDIKLNKRDAQYVEFSDDSLNFVPYPVQDFSMDLRNPLHIPSTVVDPQYEEGKSLDAFAREAMGDEFVDGWFNPFNRKVWGAETSELDSDWVATRVKAPKSGGPTKDWGPNSMFFYVPSYVIVSVLFEQVKQRHPTIKFVKDNFTGCTVLNGKFFVKYGINTMEYSFFDKIVLTSSIAGTDYPDARSLMTTTNFYQGVRTSRKYKGHTFGWLYGDVSSPLYRVSHVSKFMPNWMFENEDLFIFEYPINKIARPLTKEIFDYTNKMMDAFGFRGGEYEIHSYGSMGYPTPTLGARKIVASIKDELAEQEIYSIGRWGSHAYLNADHVFDEADNLAKHLVAPSEQSFHDYLWTTNYYPVYKKEITC